MDKLSGNNTYNTESIFSEIEQCFQYNNDNSQTYNQSQIQIIKFKHKSILLLFRFFDSIYKDKKIKIDKSQALQLEFIHIPKDEKKSYIEITINITSSSRACLKIPYLIESDYNYLIYDSTDSQTKTSKTQIRTFIQVIKIYNLLKIHTCESISLATYYLCFLNKAEEIKFIIKEIIDDTVSIMESRCDQFIHKECEFNLRNIDSMIVAQFQFISMEKIQPFLKYNFTYEDIKFIFNLSKSNNEITISVDNIDRGEIRIEYSLKRTEFKALFIEQDYSFALSKRNFSFFASPLTMLFSDISHSVYEDVINMSIGDEESSGTIQMWLDLEKV